MTTEGTLRLLWHPPPPEGSDACARMKIMAFVYRDTRRCMCSRKSCAHSPFKRIIRKIHKQFVHTGTGACSHTRTLCWDLHHDTRKRAARPPPARTTDKYAQMAYIGMHSKYSGDANIEGIHVRAHTHCLAKERDTLNSHWMWLDACRANMHSVTSVK